jgi:hypothetical protein
MAPSVNEFISTGMSRFVQVLSYTSLLNVSTRADHNNTSRKRRRHTTLHTLWQYSEIDQEALIDDQISLRTRRK